MSCGLSQGRTLGFVQTFYGVETFGQEPGVSQWRPSITVSIMILGSPPGLGQG